MRRFAFLFFALVVGLISAAQAQTPAATPKPDPELKKLQVLVGHWTYEGEYKPGPLGPGGKITAEYTAAWKLGGFVLQASETEKGATVTTHFLEVDEYNSKDKAINWTAWASDGTRAAGTITVNGNTITWEGKFTADGKEYQLKEPFSISPDHMSATATAEISPDGGKTWTPWFEATFTKTTPVAKK
jgi:hypothetical protein